MPAHSKRPASRLDRREPKNWKRNGAQERRTRIGIERDIPANSFAGSAGWQLACPSFRPFPTMMWSCTEMPSGFATRRSLRHRDIGARRRRIAGGVVVHQNDKVWRPNPSLASTTKLDPSPRPMWASGHSNLRDRWIPVPLPPPRLKQLIYLSFFLSFVRIPS